MMKLGDFRKQTKDLGDDVVLSIAEVDEVAAMNIREIEIVEGAEVRDRKAEGREAIELDGGKQKAIVLRY
jgi:uncharacterized small protein (DUF1192 family)